MVTDTNGWQAFDIDAWWVWYVREDVRGSHLPAYRTRRHMMFRKGASMYSKPRRRRIVGLDSSLLGCHCSR